MKFLWCEKCLRCFNFWMLLISVVVSLIIAFVVYGANYTQAFTYRWLLLLAIIFIAIGKALSVNERTDSKMLYYWNIAYFVLLLIAAYLISLSHIDYANYGSYLLIIVCVVDVLVTIYGYTLNKKVMKDLSMIPTVYCCRRCHSPRNDGIRRVAIVSRCYIHIT